MGILDDLGGLGEDALGLIPDVLKGQSPAQQQIASGFQNMGPVGGLINALKQTPGLARDAAVGVGDVLNAPGIVGGITGTDPVSGQSLDAGQRAMGLLGLLPVTAGVAALVHHRIKAGQLNFSDETGAIGMPGSQVQVPSPYAGRTSPNRYLGEFRPAGGSSGPSRLTYPFDATTTSVLNAGDHHEIAAALGASTPAAQRAVAGFSQALGDRLAIEDPVHAQEAQNYNNPGQAAVGAATWEMARMNNLVKNGLLIHGASQYASKFKQLVSGRLPLADQQDLQNFMVQLSQETGQVMDPHLGIAQGVKPVGIDYDPKYGTTTYLTANTLPTDPRQVDHWALVPQITQNYLDLFDQASPDQIAHGYDEYQQYHDRLAKAGDVRAGAAATALMSPRADLENNLQAAELAVKGEDVPSSLSILPVNVAKAQRAVASPDPMAELYRFTPALQTAFEQWQQKGAQTWLKSFDTKFAPKTKSFGSNIVNPNDWATTVDVHMYNGGVGYTPFFEKPPIDDHNVYEAFSAAMRQAAVERGFTNPGDFKRFQAIVWNVSRDLSNGGKRYYELNPYIKNVYEGNGELSLRKVIPYISQNAQDRIVSASSPQFPGKPYALGTTPEHPVVSDQMGDMAMWGDTKPDTRLLLRGMRPSAFDGNVADGMVEYVPAGPLPIASVERQAQNLLAVSRNAGEQGGTGYRRYSSNAAQSLPSFQRGNQILINAMQQIEDPATNLHTTGPEAHALLVQELKDLGLTFEARQLDPHLGTSVAWQRPNGELTWTPTPEERRTLPTQMVDEPRVGLVLNFGSGRRDFDLAWKHLMSEAPSNDDYGGKPKYREDGQTKVLNNQRRIYGEQVLDRTGYTENQKPPSGPTRYANLSSRGTAGELASRVSEYHWQDAAGNRIVHMNTVDNPDAPNMVYAWVPKDFLGYFADDKSTALSPVERVAAGAPRQITKVPGGAIYDNQLQIRAPRQRLTLDPHRILSSKGLNNLTLEVPKDQLPTLYVNTPGGDPTQSVGLTVDGPNRVIVHLQPLAGDAYNLSLYDRAAQTLRAVGYRGKVVARPEAPAVEAATA